MPDDPQVAYPDIVERRKRANELLQMSGVDVDALIDEAGLSFLGLGIRPPEPTWGGLVSDGRQVIITGTGWWLWVFPGACIALLVWSLNIIGDGLRDVLDPRLRGALEGD